MTDRVPHCGAGFQPARGRRPHRRADGMTLLEILIVVGIIAVLIALGTFGARYASTQARNRTTKQLLENARGMMSEYERVTFLKDVKTEPIPAPASVEETQPDRTGQAVKDTRALMAAMRALPVNRQSLEQLPPETVWQGATPAEGPILLDAWRNPIIFVPAGGLTGVRTAAGTVTIQSPEKRPFWASAGADGNFQEGKDNVYSFRQ